MGDFDYPVFLNVARKWEWTKLSDIFNVNVESEEEAIQYVYEKFVDLGHRMKEEEKLKSTS